MSLKPVWLIIASDRDLLALCEEGAIKAAMPGFALKPSGDRLIVTSDDGANQTAIILHDGSDPDAVGWEDEEVNLLKNTGVFEFAHRLEARDAAATIQLITAFSNHAKLALDNDHGAPILWADFLAKSPAEQAKFVVGQPEPVSQ